ncbi:fibronectin type III domain-containing protein [Limosilactobacillus reuteri]|uniref:fibronectin type III domain-containing protein n=1 Tax=Limosilactobacillus reuteri TaxID=1598 RepID=UPI000D6F50F8|nr:fibronectin type III domain-containing protein [Limosilactobacillus reuteri]PWT35145.1 fibronectin type III domain-containing protein [Limosilactobacillus reuteri]PWT58297.1 fibronectin type III domain-containing protein [Limosilactobacillus reuteri]PWT59911.1 fibronectin type III domain-containing protein [Limosilactobacillus reuteri]PWT66591.1 fibronectin type III domain-containing protein [Limosilactobacillus reuteri]
MSTYGMKDASNLMIVERGTHNVVLYANYANTSNVEWKSDRVYAKKKNANAIAWDGARTGELTVETELFDLKLLALVAGDKELHSGASEIMKREAYVLSADHIIKLDNKPKEGSVSVFRLKKDGIEHDVEIPQLIDGQAGSVPLMVEEVSVSAKDTSATITWSASAGADSYVVFRNGSQIGQPVTATFEDTNLTPETQYKYTVVAINKHGQSPLSAAVVVNTAASGSHVAGAAVKATEEAIKQAKNAAKVASANGLNFKILENGNIQLSDANLVGAKYVVYYMANVDGVKSFTIAADKFADNFEIFADSYIRDQQNGEDHFAQIHFKNAKPQGSFNFNQSSKEPTSLSIKFDLMPDENNEMATYKFIED